MKALAVILIFLCIAALVGVGFLCLTAGVTVDAIGCVASDAQTVPDYYTNLKEQADSDTFVGTRFADGVLPNAEACQFLTYTVRLKNTGFLTAEAVELQVTPMQGDILQIGDSESHTLRGQSNGDLQAVILTGKENHNIRQLTVSYYVWGIPFTVTAAYSH